MSSGRKRKCSIGFRKDRLVNTLWWWVEAALCSEWASHPTPDRSASPHRVGDKTGGLIVWEVSGQIEDHVENTVFTRFLEGYIDECVVMLVRLHTGQSGRHTQQQTGVREIGWRDSLQGVWSDYPAEMKVFNRFWKDRLVNPL